MKDKIKRKLSLLSFKKEPLPSVDIEHEHEHEHEQEQELNREQAKEQEQEETKRQIELNTFPQSPLSPSINTSISNSNSSSLIFERSVQHSIFSDYSSPDYFNIPNLNRLPSHHNSENFVAPVLDSTTEIITDDRLNYNNIDIISCNYKRSRSIISDSLLHCIDSNQSNNNPQQNKYEKRRENSLPSKQSNDSKKTINFYSYNDMLSSNYLNPKFNNKLVPKFTTGDDMNKCDSLDPLDSDTNNSDDTLNRELSVCSVNDYIKSFNGENSRVV